MDALRLPFDGDYRFRGKPLLLIHIVRRSGRPVQDVRGHLRHRRAAEVPDGAQQGIHFEPYEDAPSPHDEAVIAATTAFWNGYLKHRNGSAKRIIRAGTQAGLSTVTAEPR